MLDSVGDEAINACTMIFSYALIFAIVVLCIIVLFNFQWTKPFDLETYITRFNTTIRQLNNPALNSLLNGNALVNLPQLIWETDNSEVIEQVNCINSSIFLGETYDTNMELACKTGCGHNGQILEVKPGDVVVINDYKLKPGFHCVSQLPVCNLQRSFAIATTDGYMCIPKYPNMFGGETGDDIVGCCDSQRRGILWDNAVNAAVDSSTILNDENEMTANGYRFTCKYTGGYHENPVNRFKPMKDGCIHHMSGGTLAPGLKINGTDWTCDCGVYNTTRVKNLNSNNTQTPCTSCFNELNSTTDTAQLYVPAFKYNTNSKSSNANNMIPNLPSKFTTVGESCIALQLKVKLDNGATDAPFYPVDMTLPTLYTERGDLW